MPTLFRFLMVIGVITGVVAGSLYVLAEYFQPEPKEISKALRNVKAHVQEETASTPSPDTTGLRPPLQPPASAPVPRLRASPASAPVDSASKASCAVSRRAHALKPKGVSLWQGEGITAGGALPSFSSSSTC